jgi:hypothetical protein
MIPGVFGTMLLTVLLVVPLVAEHVLVVLTLTIPFTKLMGVALNCTVMLFVPAPPVMVALEGTFQL